MRNPAKGKPSSSLPGRRLALTIDDRGYPAAASVLLLAKLMALAEAVFELREAQQHAA